MFKLSKYLESLECKFFRLTELIELARMSSGQGYIMRINHARGYAESLEDDMAFLFRQMKNLAEAQVAVMNFVDRMKDKYRHNELVLECLRPFLQTGLFSG